MEDVDPSTEEPASQQTASKYLAQLKGLLGD